jgi:hypothetical protein
VGSRSAFLVAPPTEEAVCGLCAHAGEKGAVSWDRCASRCRGTKSVRRRCLWPRRYVHGCFRSSSPRETRGVSLKDVANSGHPLRNQRACWPVIASRCSSGVLALLGGCCGRAAGGRRCCGAPMPTPMQTAVELAFDGRPFLVAIWRKKAKQTSAKLGLTLDFSFQISNLISRFSFKSNVFCFFRYLFHNKNSCCAVA